MGPGVALRGGTLLRERSNGRRMGGGRAWPFAAPAKAGGGYSRLRQRIDRSIAQLPDAVVGGLHLLIMAFEHLSRARVDVVLLQGLAKRGDGEILPAFDFGQDGVNRVFRRRSPRIDPRTMDRAAKARRILGIAAEITDPLFELVDDFMALIPKPIEFGANLRIGHVAPSRFVTRSAVATSR